MADNVAITPGTGATVAADDVGGLGILWQRMKLGLGPDGSALDLTGAIAATQSAAVAGNLAVPVAQIGQWSVIHVPAANTQATATKAAGGTGVRHVCTGISAQLVATATAPTAVQLVVNLIDGASGGTSYLWRGNISLPATAGAMSFIHITHIALVGSANTAMTLEFSATGGANTVESVTLMGYDCS